MRYIQATLFFLLFVLGFPVLASPISLELTQGVSSAMPIAIVLFAGQEGTPAADNVSTVITADLSNSGQFKALDSQNMSQTPHAAKDVNAAYWRDAKVNDVVVGNVTAQGNDSYKVSFALVSVFNGQAAGNQVLVSNDFTVSGSQLRAVGHHISDIIYQQLTGTRGIFSTHIAYVLVQREPGRNRYALEVSDADGYNPKPLMVSTQPIMSPAWSKDGKQIAYVSFENITAKIYAQDVATGARHIISNYPGINGAPAWSPDSTKLALVLSKSGNPKIYILDIASGQLKQVTQGPSIDTEPSWSPDGNSLIFTSDRGGGPQIYRVTLNSGSVQRLTFNGPYNARGSMTADGQNLVMIHREQGQSYDIAAQDMQSGAITVLSRSGFDASPTVAPNGRMVMYESDVSQQGALGMVSIDGKVRLKIPAKEGSVQDPAWSPYSS